MPLSRLIGFVGKILRSLTVKPMQRYNVYNRALKYLGPDAKRFFPAPRAIGNPDGIKSLPYPHLSAKGRRGLAQKKPALFGLFNNNKSQLLQESQSKNEFVVDASNKLEVTKTVVVNPQPMPTSQSSEPVEELVDIQKGPSSALELAKKKRPLPRSTIMQRDDARVIWDCDKAPPGRLTLNDLQELMVNKLADAEHWTPKVLADRYNIKEEYADQLLNSIKQIRIVISPRLSVLMDYVGRDDQVYQATKNTIYIVDNRLRSDTDKIYDKMFLPDEKLAPEVDQLIDPPTDPQQLQILTRTSAMFDSLVRKPEPLKLEPVVNEDVRKERASIVESMPPRRVRGLTSPRETRPSSGPVNNNHHQTSASDSKPLASNDQSKANKQGKTDDAK